jgi:hypothetical protein
MRQSGANAEPFESGSRVYGFRPLGQRVLMCPFPFSSFRVDSAKRGRSISLVTSKTIGLDIIFLVFPVLVMVY